MEVRVRARRLSPRVAAPGLLLAGAAPYLFGREAFGALGGTLPDFAHTAAFALLAALAFVSARRAAWLGAAAWGLVAAAFELGQHAGWVPGTFDPADLAAIAAGCALGALLARTAGAHPAGRHALAPVLLLGAATTLGSYGPVVGDIDCYSDPPPTIRSSPPTTATVGLPYVYYVDAQWSCFFGLCNSVDGVTLPAGAEVDDFYDSVTWVPPESAVNTDVRFAIETEADFCGDHARQSWTVHVYPAPVITSFTANPVTVVPGGTTQLLAVFQGTGTIDGGVGPVTSGVAVTTAPLTATRDFVLTVSNAVGGQLVRVVRVFVEAPPTVTFLSAYPYVITAGESSTLTWGTTGSFTSAVVTPPGVDVTGWPRLVVTPDATTTYVLTLYRGTEAMASGSAQVTVVPPPVIDAFTATPGSVALHGTVTLTATFHDGTAELQAHRGYDFVSLGAVGSGVAVEDANLMRTTTYRLAVRNARGSEVSAYATVTATGPGTFQPAAGLPVRPLRARHTATLLADGRVFIAGDWPDTELFDPQAGTFSVGPSLPEALDGMAAARLPDGRVLLVGGYRSNALRSLDAHVYDPAGNTIETLGPLPVTDLVTPQAVALGDGRVLVVHPSLGQGAEAFDAVTDTFAPVGPLQVAHGCIGAVALADGRVAVIDGGGAAEVFSPLTDAFTVGGEMSQSRCHFASALAPDGRVLVTGGVYPPVPAEVFDPAVGHFTGVGTQAFAPTSGASATSLPGAVLVVGGQAVFPGHGGTSLSPMAELFDPVTGLFTMTGGLASAREGHTATRLADGRVLVVGGCLEPPCAAELYTP